MKIFTRESLEELQKRVNLIEVLSPHIHFHLIGGFYKGLCPFHDGKDLCFIVKEGDRYYHCFGCGAHGDAIQFLMQHQKMNFSTAIETLARRFRMHLNTIRKLEDESKKYMSSNVASEILEPLLEMKRVLLGGDLISACSILGSLCEKMETIVATTDCSFKKSAEICECKK